MSFDVIGGSVDRQLVELEEEGHEAPAHGLAGRQVQTHLVRDRLELETKYSPAISPCHHVPQS